ncbi:class I SAM-dependent methyltransferase [Sphaerotilus sp.]|uniref:class I SAM-dependent methyltransferase n=1 Tax=Sphaerotilus sp. TaxID=2093942 RepID=UPI0034E270AB
MFQARATTRWEAFYGSAEVVRRYAQQSRLQEPERVIFDTAIGAALQHSQLLDIGVGGGRTTVELARRCRRYVGADCAEPMVQACRERFGDLIVRHGLQFDVVDARAMPYEDASFDVVLFSFNGIDLVGAGARMTALAECRRMLRPGGHLVYSSHNLNWMDRRWGIRWHGLRDYVETQYFWSQMRRINRSAWPIVERDWLELIDPLAGGSNYYVRPQELVRQTLEQGFDDLQLYDLRGRRIDDPPQRARLTDPWVYVHARASR